MRSAQYLRSEATTAIDPNLKKVFDKKSGSRGRVQRSSPAKVVFGGRRPRKKSAMAVLTIRTRDVARVVVNDTLIF